MYFSFSAGQRENNSFVSEGKCDPRDMFKKKEEFKRPIRKGIEAQEKGQELTPGSSVHCLVAIL